MWPGYLGRDDLGDLNRTNKHSALSGDDYLGDLPGLDPEGDLLLEERIWDYLNQQTELDVSGVHLAVKDKFVSLTGTVQSLEAKATLVARVEKITGVEDVASYLEVKEPLDDF